MEDQDEKRDNQLKPMPRDTVDEILAGNWKEPQHEATEPEPAAKNPHTPPLPPPGTFKTDIETIVTADELPSWYTQTGRPFATYTLIALNILVFLGMCVTGGFIEGLTHPHPTTLLNWGADYGPLTINGQIWRVLSNTFVHIGFLHILANMMVLLYFGQIVEGLYGWRKFLVVYLVAGIGGSLASLLWNPLTVSAGASGAVFGTYGGLLAFYRAHVEQFPPRYIQQRSRTILIFIVYNLIYGAFQTNIDNAAHIGGLICGFIAGHFLVPRIPGKRDFALRDFIATTALAALLAAFAYVDLKVIPDNPHYMAYVSGQKAKALTALMKQLMPLLREQAQVVRTLAALPPEQKLEYARQQMNNSNRRYQTLDSLRNDDPEVDKLRKPLVTAAKQLVQAQSALDLLASSKHQIYVQEYSDRLNGFADDMKHYYELKDGIVRKYNLRATAF